MGETPSGRFLGTHSFDGLRSLSWQTFLISIVTDREYVNLYRGRGWSVGPFGVPSTLQPTSWVFPVFPFIHLNLTLDETRTDHVKFSCWTCLVKKRYIEITQSLISNSYKYPYIFIGVDCSILSATDHRSFFNGPHVYQSFQSGYSSSFQLVTFDWVSTLSTILIVCS